MLVAIVALVVARFGILLVEYVPTLGRVVALCVAMCLVCIAVRLRFAVAVGIVAVAILLSVTSALASHRAVVPGSYAGPAMVRADPEWKRGTARVILEIEGKRYSVVAGGVHGGRLMTLRFGESVMVTGRRSHRGTSTYDMARHIVGRFEVHEVGKVVSGASPLWRSTDRVRSLLVRASEHASWSTGGLYLGFVIGDDRAQDDRLRAAFREAGLSHLTAVSGQNIALMLGLLQPLVRRLSSSWRMAILLLTVIWFVAVTRAEPSVIRAATTSALALFAGWRGRRTSGTRVLAVATVGLLLVDPLLAWSVGFLLSISATFGIVAISPRIADVLRGSQLMRGPRWLSEVLSTTIGAQLAVLPVAFGVFRRVSMIGLLTNVPAVPLAGFVMVVGLPIGLVVGASSSAMESLTAFELGWLWEAVMLPVSLATASLRWIATTASLRH